MIHNGSRCCHRSDTRSNKIFVTLECLYGFAAAKTDELKRIVGTLSGKLEGVFCF